MSAGDLFRLKNIAKMTDMFYNSGHFAAALEFFEARFGTPFSFYAALAEFWQKKGFFGCSHSRRAKCENLYAFAAESGFDSQAAAEALLGDNAK
jgi:hypothetical protein